MSLLSFAVMRKGRASQQSRVGEGVCTHPGRGSSTSKGKWLLGCLVNYHSVTGLSPPGLGREAAEAQEKGLSFWWSFLHTHVGSSRGC